MKSGNLFQQIPHDLDEEVFAVLAQSESTRIERIVSRGHTSPDSGWYDQDENEWVIVLKGAAVLEFDNGHMMSLTVGDYIDIPSHSKHRVSWTDPDKETVWLAVHY